MPSNFDDVVITGTMQARGAVTLTQGLPRTQLAQENAKAHPIDLGTFKISTTGQPLTATASGSDLGYTAGTYATSNQYVQAGDVKTLTGSRLARFTARLPDNYVAGQPVSLRFAAGMLTTVAATSCTILAAAYKVGRDSLVSGGNLVTTGATTINSLTFGDKDFVLTPTGLNPGDVLDVLVTIAYADAATGTVVRPVVAAADVVCSIKG